jgi:16S rRNA (cytosine1402-N4)-methyltransferase
MEAWANLHQPVMANELLRLLAVRPDGAYCDATLGLGGHSERILTALDERGRLFGVDRDESALRLATQRLARFGDRFRPIHGPFGDLPTLLAAAQAPALDGLIADLGVSSLQLDRPERGFSFQTAGPVDMRMDCSHGETALELMERLDEHSLAAILWEYGEERHSRRVARAIKQALSEGIVVDTLTLAAVVAKAIPQREPHKNPATRTFQALRIAVNDELRQVHSLLLAAPLLLKPGGRLVIISFHSLEDRLVKQHLSFVPAVSDAHRTRGSGITHNPFVALAKGSVTPSEEELAGNPRSRSARIRAARTLTLEERASQRSNHPLAQGPSWPL